MNNTLNLTKENLIEKSIRFSFLCKENHFSKYYGDLYQEINDYWHSMNISNSVKFSEKIYCWSTGINPLCKRNNKRSFISLSKGYNHGACYKQCPCSIEKHKETMQLLYNVDSPMQSPEIMKKRDDTFLEKYGTDKLSEINLKKKEQTNIDRYGHKTPLQSSEIRNKCKLSYKEKTGYNTPFENSQVQKNIQNHWEETTGKNTYIRTKEDGIKESEKYIKENFGEKGLVLLDKHDLEKVIEKLSPYMLSKQIGCSEGLIYKKIRQYNITTNLKSNESYYEKELFYIFSEHFSITRNRRDLISPKEIDLYFDDYSYGIEFCGITWHGENNNRSEFYHQNKFKDMDSKDMNLVQIFSDDYIRYKDSIVDNIFIDLGICEYVKNYTLEYYDNYDYIEKFIDENRYMIYHSIGKEFLVIKIKNIIIGIISYDDKTIKDIFITKSLKLDNLFEKISNFFQDDIFYEHQISNGNRYFTKNLIKISYTEPLRFYRKKNIRYDYEVESYDDIIWDCGKIIYKKEFDKNDNIKRN